MGQQDELLLGKAQKGDMEAFESLILLYEKKVYNIAFRMMGNPEDALDVSQEAFLKIYRSLNGFNEQSTLSTWIYRITMNTCLDELRKRKNKKLMPLDDVGEGEIFSFQGVPDSSPESHYSRKIQRESIQNAISSLPEEYRSTIVLREIQGFSYDEIAEILQCSLGTVKSRLSRGRKELQRKLLQDPNFHRDIHAQV